MERRKFSREFKLEAVKLVLERGVSAAQAARDLDVHANPQSGTGRRVRLHRALLQPDTQALDLGISQPHGVREAG